MARKKRGGKAAVSRKTRSSAKSTENAGLEEQVVQSPCESEESCGSGTPKSCNTPIETDKPTALIQHKKFGKFRCLLMDDSNKTEISSSESEVQGSEADSKEAETSVTDNIIEHFKSVEISETESSQDFQMCVEEVVQDETSMDLSESMLYNEQSSVSEIIGVEIVKKESRESEEKIETEEKVEIEENLSNESKEADLKDNKKLKGDDSNGTTVRRSSRIKSISVLKQRSKGHGLVKSDKDKREKSKVSRVIETDSESNSERAEIEKVPLSLDSPSFAVPLSGFESEQKPVKVKSRWRRSSELEMGSSSPITQFIVSPQTILELPESNSPQLKDLSPVYDEEMENRLKQFQTLTENQYLTERTSCKEAKKMLCDCFLTKEEIGRGEFGCGEDCLNRLLMIECGSHCVVGDRCTNKRFQNTQYSSCEVFRTEKKGFGMRAVAEIGFGEFIMEYVGEVLDPDEFDKRAKEYSKDKNRHYYFMALRADAVIDATQKGNISRFINHSCEPNAETQKWTVNGELRIGFFSKRTIHAGEEITFDYQFQRYGKEAQKCFCETSMCRGWIGEEPDDEDEDEDDEEESEKEEEEEVKETDVIDETKVVKPKAKRVIRKRKYTKKQDLDLDEEIKMLSATGIKSQPHTLTLSRVMVRAKDIGPRMQLLKLLHEADLPCRRLFLDYHGLRLINGWMCDARNMIDSKNKNHAFRNYILQTIGSLPIPNKTMLQDSKVLMTVENWSLGNKSDMSSPMDSEENDSPRIDGPAPEVDTKKEPEPDESIPMDVVIDEETLDLKIEMDISQGKEMKELAEEKVEVKIENDEDMIKREEREQEKLILALCAKLLSDWSSLKEVFRIPKKERIEQMKEHEREADRDYKADLESEIENRERENRYSRKNERYRPIEKERRKPKESERNEHERTTSKKGIRLEERNIVPIPKLTKQERRQLFALQVAQEEEGRRRKQEQEMWRQHEQKCLMMGTDPRITPAFDINTGYQCYWNPNTSQWQNVPSNQSFPPNISNTSFPPNQNFPPPNPSYPSNSFSSAASFPPGPQPMYEVMAQPMCQNATPHLPLLIPPVPSIDSNRPTPLPQPNMAPFHTPIIKEEQTQYLGPVPPPVKLPPKWKCAKDKYGRPYYYHIKIRLSQWEPPEFLPTSDCMPSELVDSSSSSESSSLSSDTSSDSEDDSEIGDTKLLLEIRKKLTKQDEVQPKPVEEILPTTVPDTLAEIKIEPHVYEPILESESTVETGQKRKRDGLVTEIIISPRRDEDKLTHKADLKKYKETKEKLRRQKEMILEQTKKRMKSKSRTGSSAKPSKRHSSRKSKLKTMGSMDMNSEEAKKIKETFRSTMASVMVQNLNAYRKPDCKIGRITNTEDFKHLARKLTHFVMLKEIKHCQNVEDLMCNESVKAKAKDFVKKYMAKFGEVYQRPKDELD